MKRKQQPPEAEQGFALMEVLVAILIIIMFTSTGMVGLTLAAAFKSKARAASAATAWIQADLEAVKNQAAQLSYALAADASAGQSTLVLTSTNGLVNNEQIAVGTDSIIYTIQSINGNAITLTSNLTMSQAASAKVINVSKCNATTATAGFAYDLQQTLPTLSSGGTLTIAGKPYTLSRNLTINNAAPYDVLQLAYTVAPQSGGATVATMYSEVIPNAVYQCPKSQ